MTNNNTELEQQIYYLEGELTSACKMMLMNEVALRTSRDITETGELGKDDQEMYTEKVQEAQLAKKGLERKIKALRQVIAELKDGTLKI